MDATTTTTVKLDESDIRTALIEYVNRTCREGRASAGGGVEIERVPGTPGSRGRDGQYTATVTIVEAD